MRKLLLVAIALPHLLFSQAQQGSGATKFEASLGANYTLLQYEGVDFERRINPFIGANLIFDVHENIDLKASVLYSVRSSHSVSPHFWHRNTYAELKLMPGVQLNDFLQLNVGVAASMLLKSSEIVLDGGSLTGRKANPLSGYDSEYHPVIGFDLNLDQRLILGINYFIPISGESSRNLQMGLQIPINF
jgi:hypothetical protein